MDVIDVLEENMKNKGQGGAEIMWKKNLSWADLASIDISPALRKLVIEKLTGSDKFMAGDINLIDLVKK